MSEEKTLSIIESRCKQIDFVRTMWGVTAEHGMTREDVEKPEFWAHTAKEFTVSDRIEITNDDGSFIAEYYVTSCGKNSAKVKNIFWIDLTDGETELLESAMEVKWAGRHAKFRVIRKADGAVQADKMETKAEALQWLADHERKIA